jgi:hypothetical protein
VEIPSRSIWKKRGDSRIPLGLWRSKEGFSPSCKRLHSSPSRKPGQRTSEEAQSAYSAIGHFLRTLLAPRIRDLGQRGSHLDAQAGSMVK